MSSRKQLFYPEKLQTGQQVMADKPLSKRLAKVLRLKKGDEIALFNGVDGLFVARLADDGATTLQIDEKLADQYNQPACHLFICVLKRDAMDRVVRQAVELGATHLHPVLSDFCVPDKLNTDRLRAIIIEAAEQCERLDIPELKPLKNMQTAINEFLTASPQLFWAAERTTNNWGQTMPATGDGLLIGPEGGFSPAEKSWLEKQSQIMPVGLGNLVLKADTAVVAGLSRFQEYQGK